jgi:hypothetical protein
VVELWGDAEEFLARVLWVLDAVCFLRGMLDCPRLQVYPDDIYWTASVRADWLWSVISSDKVTNWLNGKTRVNLTFWHAAVLHTNQ